MTSQEVARAVVDWAVGELPALQASYAHAEPERVHPLPDVMAFVTRKRTVDVPADASLQVYGGATQQTLALLREVRLVFAADPEDAEAASDLLEGFADTLDETARHDRSLRGRLGDGGVSPLTDWSFDPPFIEFDDGVRARQATLTLTVAHPVPVRSPVPA